MPPSDGETEIYDWDQITGDLPSHGYLAPAALEWITKQRPESLLDIGCGDGRLTAKLAELVPRVVGFDFSETGVQRAKAEHPGAEFFAHPVDDPLSTEHRGCYELVCGIEVIEHLLLPRSIFKRASEALAPEGRLLLTTPYHGYTKNLALSVLNKWDSHHTVGWDYGHIKFFSPKTLNRMAEEMGFRLIEMKRVGRIPIVAASMVVVYERM